MKYLLLVFLPLCSCEPNASDHSSDEEKDTPAYDIEALVKTEDIVLDLSKSLLEIAQWSMADDLKYRPTALSHLQEATPLSFSSLPTALEQAWSVKDVPIEPLTKAENTHPWENLLTSFSKIHDAKFSVKKAHLIGLNEITTTLTYSASAHYSGAIYGLQAEQNLTWIKSDSLWKVTKWEQKKFTLTAGTTPFFVDTLESALPDSFDHDRATRSYHDELLKELVRNGTANTPAQKITEHFSITSSYCFPAVSVVDYDNDGWDDLFLTARWGPTQLLRNSGDGTFSDVTSRSRLREPYAINCSIFADLDNDGDQDAILGSSLFSSKILENRDGRFRELPVFETLTKDLSMVAGISVSDVNQDGLLDIYLSTYRPEMKEDDAKWISTFLTEEEEIEIQKLLPGANRWTNNIGPPNYLLINRGGNKFDFCPLDGPWTLWRDSFQSAWADYDGDGDDDLYICNDFAPDVILRNDTPPGASMPIFVEASSEVFVSPPMAFGMGADWGDFDNDGDLDLYVSNMYSKAAKRVFSFLGDGIGNDLRAAAAGNFLYENRDGKLIQIAGPEEGQQHVHQVGWSWGGQFADFDNDADLDLYVPSGYYTAPEEVASDVDL